MRKNITGESTPTWQSDAIVDEMIRELLSDRVYYAKQSPGWKYDLTDPKKKIFYESKFKHGVKILPAASESMFEANLHRDGTINLIGLFPRGINFISVAVPERNGDYYLGRREIQDLVNNGIGLFYTLPNGSTAFIIQSINRQTFLDCLIKRK